MSEQSVCQEVVRGDYTSRRCGRPVKDDGLCGIHLAAKKRREAGDLKRVEQRRRDDVLRAEADQIGLALGIVVKPDWAYSGGYTGDFVVPGDWLRARVAK